MRFCDCLAVKLFVLRGGAAKAGEQLRLSQRGGTFGNNYSMVDLMEECVGDISAI